jgi:hypothetical protein
VLVRRAYDNKQAALGGWIRGTVFLILFVTHYVYLVRKEKETS